MSQASAMAIAMVAGTLAATGCAHSKTPDPILLREALSDTLDALIEVQQERRQQGEPTLGLTATETILTFKLGRTKSGKVGVMLPVGGIAIGPEGSAGTSEENTIQIKLQNPLTWKADTLLGERALTKPASDGSELRPGEIQEILQEQADIPFYGR